ncbi:MAG: Eco57I restriction-modification methylase domain-containing protein [Clostridium sp.]|nr:MAG: Eco57I restriction-modification methylase domain-containing protein [Clostridium sp.]
MLILNLVFPGVDINGGVCFFLRDASYNGLCDFTNVTDGIRNKEFRKIK